MERRSGTVLVGYEYGLGLGHLARTLPVARALKARGHEVIYFLYNPSEIAAVLNEEALPLLPVTGMKAEIPGMTHTPAFNAYSDFMAMAGFYSREQLRVALNIWQTIFEYVRPDLIVCDHSPFCCLAAFGRIPVIQLGDGFTLPPVHEAWFPLIRGQAARVDQEFIFDNMRAVQKHCRRKIPEAITEPFQTAARLLCTLPEIDHYAIGRRDPVAGPPERDCFFPEPFPEEKRIFAYLKKDYRYLDDIIAAICRIALPCDIVINGLPGVRASWRRNEAVKFYDTPQPVGDLLRKASVVLHHGGNGLSCAALSMGRMQLVAPAWQESELTAEALSRIGAGRILRPGEIADGTAGGIVDALAGDLKMADRVQSIARDIQSRGPWNFMKQSIAVCERILCDCR
ncbi:MAG TPA: nucleotide disphospho-sugar-binding domain-containing protein [Acidobacteriota bacterium]|nr:nucleotide disphospho-sugar-binding domain-containing protein [Acidobacteriota bacterium]